MRRLLSSSLCSAARLRRRLAGRGARGGTLAGRDGRRRHEAAGVLHARAAAAGDVRVRLERARALGLRADRDVPRNGLTLGAMSEPQRKLAHDLLQDRTQPARLPDRDLDHGSRDHAPRHRGCAAAATPPGPGRTAWSAIRSSTSSRSSARRPRRAPGAGASKAITSRSTSRSSNGSLVASAPSFFGSNPAEVREGPKKGLRILAAEEDTARALLMALDEAAARQGRHQHGRARTTSRR